MLADKAFLDELLAYVGSRLKHEVNGLLIGGNAMIYYGLRGQTKDLDLVFYRRQDLTSVISAVQHHPLYRGSNLAEALPYKARQEVSAEKPTIIEKGDLPRFDLFYKNVFSVATEKMLERASRVLRFDLLSLRLAEPEDLIYMKAVTERPLDQQDISRLIETTTIEWEKFMENMKEAFKTERDNVFYAIDTLRTIKNFPKEKLQQMADWFGMEI